MAKILIVDDERSIRNTIRELLEMEGYKCETAENGKQALEMSTKGGWDLVITDIKMPEMDGVELLAALHRDFSDLPVVMISGHGTIDIAVDCLKAGAFDYISKPIELNRLLVTVRNALDNSELMKETKTLRRKLNSKFVAEIIGESEVINKVKSLVKKVAPSDARVLITGSNGTGKELVARWLHEMNARSKAPFVEVNCAAIPSELIESELFGHEKGAFTSAVKQRKGKFEQAEGGTIFLDEIGDMSLAAQAKVLRALQEKKISRVGSDTDISVDVRVVAATNKDLQSEIAKGNFREDLYHRLSVIIVHVPTLAQRREDIPLLVEYFLKQYCNEQGISLKKITAEAVEILKQMEWTGNIRELRNVVERLVILGEDTITAEDVNSYVVI
ncbi:Sigma-54 dependent transcriptional regulator/response regulator [Mucinivorans hirudinis]|uniref:Sigma-54 dependent transcriptional regulator/response regulator n=1 Tax=Mucinivorans hirudinis TaxID=1433126 RepID=A0A060R9D2_9BACT|nr:Sigma-54 dependent transcriptional regulator/response regulator [Mucinivorans hirudinis]